MSDLSVILIQYFLSFRERIASLQLWFKSEKDDALMEEKIPMQQGEYEHKELEKYVHISIYYYF